MEGRFGEDFRAVRVHTDSVAAESASAVHASAYSVGSDVVFGAAQYAPQTPTGRKLIAHELTHVVQQKRLGRDGISHLKIGAENDPTELEAERVATASAADTQDHQSPSLHRAPAVLQRKGSPTPPKSPSTEPTTPSSEATIPPASTASKPAAGIDIKRLKSDAHDFSVHTTVNINDINEKTLDYNNLSATMCPVFAFTADLQDNRKDRTNPYVVGFIQNVLCSRATAQYENAVTTWDISGPMLDSVTSGPQEAQVFASFFNPFYSDDAVALFDNTSPRRQLAILQDCPGFRIPFCRDRAGLIRVARSVTLKTWVAIAPLDNWWDKQVVLQETNPFRFAFCITFDPWAILSQHRFCNIERDCASGACKQGSFMSMSWGSARSSPVVAGLPSNMVPLTHRSTPPVTPKPCPGRKYERTNHTTLCFT
jgi:hypothetical protein